MPDGQARWEAYMFMLATRQWCHKDLIGRVVLVGDAEGVISSLCRFSSRDPVINCMAKEIGLWLAPWGYSLEGVHVWGEQNTWADALSRQVMPTQLYQTRCAVPSGREASSWKMMKGARDLVT
jgi:hypothetical protein